MPTDRSMMSRTVFSVDAESDGLYGDIWAVGVCVMRPGSGSRYLFGGRIGSENIHDPWVREHIDPVVALRMFPSRDDLLNEFWAFWRAHGSDAVCLADFGAPVEARLFRECVALDPDARTWQGPYPMHELGTALLLAGVDPDIDRRAYSGDPSPVQHNPVHDAIAAALCWRRALEVIAGGP